MPHYFDKTPQTPSKPSTVSLTVAGQDLTLTTDRGVFSGARVDLGTSVLLDVAPPPRDSGNLLDLGCGYGPITVSLAVQSPHATVWATDVNERARNLCAKNATDLGLTNVYVHAPENVPTDITFDELWSNPPARIGKDQLHDMLSGWLSRLTPDGFAYLVVNKNLGSDSLQRWLIESGWDSERLGSKKGFRVLRCLRHSQ